MNAKNFVIATVSFVVLVALPGVAAASSNTAQRGERGLVNVIERRIDRQYRRIQKGWDDGSLTRREYRQLMRGNRRLNRKLNWALDDGFLSHWEENRLFNMLGNQSAFIRELKNNHRVAGMGRGFRQDRRWEGRDNRGFRNTRSYRNTRVVYR